MKGLRLFLPPFAPDDAGAASVLFPLGGLVVIVDAGGCAGNISGFDENYVSRHNIFGISYNGFAATNDLCHR